MGADASLPQASSQPEHAAAQQHLPHQRARLAAWQPPLWPLLPPPDLMRPVGCKVLATSLYRGLVIGQHVT